MNKKETEMFDCIVEQKNLLTKLMILKEKEKELIKELMMK